MVPQLVLVHRGSLAERRGLREGLYLHSINRVSTQELGQQASRHLAEARPLRLCFGTRARLQRRRSERSVPSRSSRSARVRRAAPVPREAAAPEPSWWEGGLLEQLVSLATCTATGQDSPHGWAPARPPGARGHGGPDSLCSAEADVRPVAGATAAQIARAANANEQSRALEELPVATGQRPGRGREDGSWLTRCGGQGSATAAVPEPAAEPEPEPEPATEPRRWSPPRRDRSIGNERSASSPDGMSEVMFEIDVNDDEEWAREQLGYGGGGASPTGSERAAVAELYRDEMRREKQKQQELAQRLSGASETMPVRPEPEPEPEPLQRREPAARPQPRLQPRPAARHEDGPGQASPPARPGRRGAASSSPAALQGRSSNG